AAFRNHVDLGAPGSSSLGCVDISADAKFRNRVERNVKSRVGLLCLFLDSAGVDPVKSEVAVIQRMTREADGPLGAVSIINCARDEQYQACPVPAADRNPLDLIFVDEAANLCRTSVERVRGGCHLYGSGDRSDLQPDIHRARLAY